MKFPGYPSNREADESAKAFCHRKPLRKREGAQMRSGVRLTNESDYL